MRHALRLASVLVLAVGPAPAQESPRPTVAETRRAIAEANREWGKARVALDRPAMERMLAPEFFVQLPNRKLSRKEFLDMVSESAPGGKLTRFDVTVLTVEPSSDGWVAVIEEKLEFVSTTDPSRKAYSLWVTRDGWKNSGGRWTAVSSEAIGNETWRAGEKPPFRDW